MPTEEVIEVADTLGAGVAKALLGKAAVPDDLPFVTGSIGLLGTRPSWDLMQDCDTLLMVGSSFPYSEFLPEEGAGPRRADRPRRPDDRDPLPDGGQPRRRQRADAAKRCCRCSSARRTAPGARRSRRTSREWWKLIEARAHEPAEPINPQLIFHELSKRLPDGAILTSDSGSAANWYARDVRLRAGMMASLSGTLATMGPGVPYAIAAKFAHPDRPVIALVGDGAMQMNGLAELITIAKYRERWPDQRLIVLVLNNRDLNQVTWEQRAMSGDPKFVESQELPDVPYARWAEMLGLNGIRTDDPERDRRVLGPGARQRSADGAGGRAATPRCRRCRRTSPSSRPARSPRRSCTATPAAGGSSPSRCARSCPSSSPADEPRGCWGTSGAAERSARCLR